MPIKKIKKKCTERKQAVTINRLYCNRFANTTDRSIALQKGRSIAVRDKNCAENQCYFKIRTLHNWQFVVCAIWFFFIHLLFALAHLFGFKIFRTFYVMTSHATFAFVIRSERVRFRFYNLHLDWLQCIAFGRFKSAVAIYYPWP